MKQYQVVILCEVARFLERIDTEDRGMISRQIEQMETADFSSLFIKTIYSPLRELKIKKYRLLFFINKNIIYIISAFIKKSQKTPQREIIRAQNIIKLLLQ